MWGAGASVVTLLEPGMPPGRPSRDCEAGAPDRGSWGAQLCCHHPWPWASPFPSPAAALATVSPRAGSMSPRSPLTSSCQFSVGGRAWVFPAQLGFSPGRSSIKAFLHIQPDLQVREPSPLAWPRSWSLQWTRRKESKVPVSAGSPQHPAAGEQGGPGWPGLVGEGRGRRREEGSSGGE